MKKSPAFQFYPKDFLVDTAILSAEETGVYIRLLCYAWTGLPGFKQGYIPLDERAFDLVGVSLEKWRIIQDKILPFFCEKGDGVYCHKRMIEELKKQKTYRDQRVMAGKASAKKRNESSTSVTTSVQRKSNSSTATSSSTTVTKKTKKKVSEEDVQKVIENYRDFKKSDSSRPKGTDRVKTLIESGSTPEDLILFANRYHQECKADGKEAKYIQGIAVFYGPGKMTWKGYGDDWEAPGDIGELRYTDEQMALAHKVGRVINERSRDK